MTQAILQQERAVGEQAVNERAVGEQAVNERAVGEQAVGERALPSDDTLAIWMRSRDELALGLLYDRYGRLVYTIALRITGSPETAEEVTQDTFQQAWQGIEGYRLGQHLGAWLCGIARHRAIDALRSRRERARQRESAALDTLQEVADEAALPATVAEHQDLRATVRRALALLPASQRMTLELAYFAGLSCSEIAQRLGTPPGTVRSRLRLGMLRLRGTLEPYFSE